jgi:hypothetical protein
MSFPRRIKAVFPAAVLALAVLGSPGAVMAQIASPQEIAIARQTALEGLTAYRAGQFDKALALFEQARAVYPSAQVLRMEGYSLLALDQWIKAADSMDAALTSEIGPLSPEDRTDVEQQLAKAMVHLGVINISSTVPGAQLTVDGGAPIALPLNKPLRMLEGKHTFVVTAPDHEDASEEISLEGGKAIDKVLDPTKKKAVVVEAPKPPPLPPPPPKKTSWFSMQREIGIAAGGAGVALGVATLTTALVGAHIRSNVATDVDLHKKNFGETCNKGDYRLCTFDRAVINSDADRADGLRDASVGLGIAAGVLVASGVVLVIFSGDSSAKPTEKENSAGAAPSAKRSEAPGRFACGIAGASGIACTGTF